MSLTVANFRARYAAFGNTDFPVIYLPFHVKVAIPFNMLGERARVPRFFRSIPARAFARDALYNARARARARETLFISLTEYRSHLSTR